MSDMDEIITSVGKNNLLSFPPVILNNGGKLGNRLYLFPSHTTSFRL